MTVFLAFLLLMLLICATPALIFIDVPIAHGLMAATTAFAAALVGIGVPPGEGAHLERLIRPWAAVALAPALWMVLQALPLPSFLSNFAHPIWSSAAGALNQAIAGSISIDPGMTIIALGRYLTALGVILVATAATIERARARSSLLVLTAVMALAAVLMIAADWGVVDFAALAPAGAPASALSAMVALGVVISLAAAIQAFEWRQTPRHRAAPAGAAPAMAVGACIAACALCGFALHSAPAPVLLATACGVAVVLLTAGARRLGAGPWANAAMVMAGLGAVVVAVLARGQDRGDLAIRFAIAGPKAASERMIADSSAAGSGAGTFSAVLPVYGTVEDIAGHAPPPSAAALAVIELGRPMWVFITLAVMVLAASMVRRAILRGRDWQCPAASVGAVVLITLESFADATLVNSGVMTIAAAIVGVGLAQSLSRTVQ